MRAERQRLCGSGVLLLLAILSPAVALAGDAPPEPELLEFLALFAEADDEALDLALGSVENERDAGSRQTGQGEPAEEDEDESR